MVEEEEEAPEEQETRHNRYITDDETVLHEESGSENSTNNQVYVLMEANKVRIDKKTNWSKVKNKFTDSDFSAEGGELNYYFNNDLIEKIEAQFMGETYNEKLIYYLINSHISIVKQTIEEHHGEISVKNADHSGAVFTLILPIPFEE